MSTANQTEPVIRKGEPFSDEKVESLLEDFYRDGYVYIPGVLEQDEIQVLKAGIDRVIDDPKMFDTHNRYSEFVGVRLFETDRIFRDMLVREPIIGLAEAVLGETCHLMAQNVVRNQPGQAISNFHVDKDQDCGVEFPCPPDMPRHDPRYKLPVFRLGVQIMLTDVDGDEHGPTQFVPASHYSGRDPNDKDHPTFEGRGPVSVHCKAGDIYLHNGQCWHRGAPNTSDRTRYLLQQAYCQRWVAQRFYPFLNYRMPDHVLEGADERLLRVLGKHPKGPYG